MEAASVSGSSLSIQAINFDENSHIALLRQLSYRPVHAVSHRGRRDPQNLSNFPIPQAFRPQQQALPLSLCKGSNGHAQLLEFLFREKLTLGCCVVQHVVARSIQRRGEAAIVAGLPVSSLIVRDAE